MYRQVIGGDEWHDSYYQKPLFFRVFRTGVITPVTPSGLATHVYSWITLLTLSAIQPEVSMG